MGQYALLHPPLVELWRGIPAAPFLLSARVATLHGVVVHSTRPMLKFFILFIAIQLALFAAELTPPVQERFVIPFTEGIAKVSVNLVTLFDDRVVAAGKVIRSLDNGFAVSIEAGCNGVEAMIVLAAAIIIPVGALIGVVVFIGIVILYAVWLMFAAILCAVSWVVDLIYKI